MPFFRYFQVDLYRECPFWPDQGFCNNPSCAITSVDESDVPEKWRAKALSEVDPSSIDKRHSLPGCYYRDSDFCFLDDNTEGDYFDLRLVPERYTGYSGKDAQRVWRSIYEENCFGLSELNLMTSKSPGLVSLPDTMAEALHQDNQDSDTQCLEKRVYYKVISGLHASISTHICHEYLNQTTGEWHPNLKCFIQRVASHPERLQYIYFNTILLLRAVARLGPYLEAFDYCSTGTHEDDTQTLTTLSKVVGIASTVGKFDESVLFRGENANIVKEEFKTHFRNVTRIMDCIGCDKCRLWGKVQTTGIATALKILFELDEKALDPQSNTNLLQRSEVVALMNTLFRFSESLQAVDTFRKMWRELDEAETRQIVSETEKMTAPRPLKRHGPLHDQYTVMIILDEDLDSGQAKTDSDSYPGLTLRHPQAVHARSSTSTLPDYDTSEAQHRKVVTRSALSLGKLSPRVWKIVIGVLLGYTVLSLAIGLPIVLLKGRDRDDSFSLAPTSSLWVSEDVVLPGPLQLATTGIPTITNNMTCNIWDTHPDIENTQFARFKLPPQGLITIRSNVTYEKVAADNINGTLWVYMNQDKKEKDIIFNVSMKSSSNNVRLQTNVCFSEQGSSRGLTIYVPDTLGIGDLLTFNILVLLPQRKASIDQFLVYLPLLEHRIGYVQKQIEVTQFTLEGAARPMSCEFLQACQVTFKNIMGSISGSFNVSNSLTLDTIKAPIHSNVTLTQGRLSPKPVILSMDTGDGS
ncbi:hypothetical protein NLJ89_g3017 [Agrocybe chaxingu]|uniref:Endoplasmic oxidoreductin-1 n=1 Tax=Agrocybe chaxingu TaxID=84603 RepID=A0A9W8K6D4_9AGAR|nr:hypothetical protein NLJ89_g3017 [Agrocybe chaxingu]